MNLQSLLKQFTSGGCKKVFVKRLSPNDNSKNQVYLGANFDLLNIFPVSEIKAVSAGDWKRERFISDINFSWIRSKGNPVDALTSKFILYPKYPEVRFSGFLNRCEDPPSDLMTSRDPGRLLFLGNNGSGRVLGFVASPDSSLAVEFNNLKDLTTDGVFQVLDLSNNGDSRSDLLAEMLRIHQLGWIDSKRLNSSGQVLPCNASNCGGYTLEAELGITPNGYSEPDFLGWEMKQFGVSNFDRVNAKAVTLMTPEPTGGVYKSQGVESFVRQYGYEDKRGRPDRLNFGGVHRANLIHETTKLTLVLDGFDAASGKIRDTNGAITLIDKDGNAAASWSFVSLLKHWNKKHRQACYVPSVLMKNPRKYSYSHSVLLGVGTDFGLFLKALDSQMIYYDPGIKLENASSSKPTTKRRSQFRIKSGDISTLYHNSGFVNLK
jgi:hypothetical protein